MIEVVTIFSSMVYIGYVCSVETVVVVMVTLGSDSCGYDYTI